MTRQHPSLIEHSRRLQSKVPRLGEGAQAPVDGMAFKIGCDQMDSCDPVSGISLSKCK